MGAFFEYQQPGFANVLPRFCVCFQSGRDGNGRTDRSDHGWQRWFYRFERGWDWHAFGYRFAVAHDRRILWDYLWDRNLYAVSVHVGDVWSWHSEYHC